MYGIRIEYDMYDMWAITSELRAKDPIKIVTVKEIFGPLAQRFVDQIGGRTRMGWVLQDNTGDAVKLSRKFGIEECKLCVESRLTGWHVLGDTKESLDITVVVEASPKVLSNPDRKSVWIRMVVVDEANGYQRHIFYSDGTLFYYWGRTNSIVFTHALRYGAVLDLELVAILREKMESHEL